MSTVKKQPFTTRQAAIDLLKSTEVAIQNMIAEVRRPVDPELSGSQRKAELQSIKQTAIDAKDMLQIRQQLEEMVTALDDGGQIEKQKDFGSTFAERFAKK